MQLAVAIVVVVPLNAGFAFWQETAAVPLVLLEHRVVRPGVLAPRGRP